MDNSALEQKVMDELMDAPAPVTDISDELEVSQGVIRRVLRQLQASGLIYQMGETISAGNQRRAVYDMTRTRKAA